MAKITKKEFEEFVEKEFPGRGFKWEYDDKTGKGYFYIQASRGKYPSDELHYEFIDGRVRLHIEGDNWWWLRQELYNRLSQSQYEDLLQGAVWNKRQNCQWILIPQKKDIFDMFRRIRTIIEPEIIAYESGVKLNQSMNNDISYETKTIDNIYALNLRIPKYQRIYTWQREHVETLLNDIAEIYTKEYHIGTIVLHSNKHKENDEQVFDIVDGQQRLVTLALILYTLNPQDPYIKKFLECEYASNEALANIQKNYNYIVKYLENTQKKNLIRININRLTFGVLTINNNNLDLAFKFFRNTNSKGKTLSDYDLLKPHHLRYIPLELEDQQLHLAKKWDSMIRQGYKQERIGTNSIPYIRVLEYYLFRLRKWSMLSECDTSSANYIKKEYEAAKTISEIPPLGEQFDFFEPIQGGQHFFAFVDHFLHKYDEFKQKDIIQNAFGLNGSHSWYGLVIECLLFCYFLRFGSSYINEAALSIIRYISIIRFVKGRAYEPTILRWARDSKIVQIIQHATSPTFVLASIETLIDEAYRDDVEDASTGVRYVFYNICKELSQSLNKETTTNYYNNYFNCRYSYVKSSNT